MKSLLVYAVLFALAAIIRSQDDFVLQQQAITFQQIPLPEEPTPSPSQPSSPLPTLSPFRPIYQLDIPTLHLLRYQLLGISLIFFYLILYIQGKNKNLAIMQNFYRKVDRYLQNNFAHVGFSKTSGQAPFNGQSPSESLYYATGRQHVDGIQMRFNTKKRHDLIYSLYDIFFPQKDAVTIDIPVKSDLMLVLALAGKRKMKEMTENYLDIRKMAGKFGVRGLHDSYEVLGQAGDTIDNIIDNYVIKRLNEFQGLFISIHYTDLKTYSQSTGHLRVILNTTHKNQDHFLPALELILHLADKIATLKLTANSKAKAQKARQVYSQLKEREDLQKHNEQLRKKKEQKLRQQDLWLRSLPPEKQKREEEKRKKKQFNKLFKGKTMKM